MIEQEVERFSAICLIIPASLSAVIFAFQDDFPTIQEVIHAAWRLSHEQIRFQTVYPLL